MREITFHWYIGGRDMNMIAHVDDDATDEELDERLTDWINDLDNNSDKWWDE